MNPFWHRLALKKHTLQCVGVTLLIVTASFVVVMANPAVQSQGTITVDPTAGTISLDASVAAGWTSESINLLMALNLSNTGIDRLSADASVALGEVLTTGLVATFDPQASSFTQSQFGIAAALQDANLSFTGLLEPNALGWSVDLASTTDSVLQAIAIGFNIDPFGGIQTESCRPAFTYARFDLAIPLDGCNTTASVSSSWDCAGFGELSLSVPTVGGLAWGVQIGALLTFAMDKKTLEFFPTLNLDNPECFDFYTGLEWDNVTNTISAINFYGVGFRCEINDVQVRILYSLDPSTIALVKSPFKSLIGFVWPMPGCCGEPGEASVAFFFGEDNLFDLGEILFDAAYPAAENLSFSLSFTLPMDGGPTFSFGWSYEL